MRGIVAEDDGSGQRERRGIGDRDGGVGAVGAGNDERIDGGGGVETSVTVKLKSFETVLGSEPTPTALTVTVFVPRSAVTEALIVNVLLEADVLFGLNVAVTPFGTPLRLVNCTGP